MTLFEAKTARDYVIKGVFVEETITRRLEALGLNDGTILHILTRKKNGALIIMVRGTRLALGKHISSGIEIEEAEDSLHE
ncbi:MAG: FeoA domain-containing protein [Lachnospiraceae bacterium]